MERTIFFRKEKVGELRKREGLSQLDFARRIGTSRQMVQRWESGDCDPQADTIGVMCDTFKLSPDWFFVQDLPIKENDGKVVQPQCRPTSYLLET